MFVWQKDNLRQNLEVNSKLRADCFAPQTELFVLYALEVGDGTCQINIRPHGTTSHETTT